ncbi:beta-1,4-galactosyltransferase galt-1-like [Physella acuta]|uniref:beta-1,4-galactosyltransferase galt-1-like n=1 Tax=Physella acuta TaxID=109671 RepID=UPI0027DCCF11|nr:beta-1,4-galactosyltransferase galt-1-like [Physella acuta]
MLRNPCRKKNLCVSVVLAGVRSKYKSVAAITAVVMTLTFAQLSLHVERLARAERGLHDMQSSAEPAVGRNDNMNKSIDTKKSFTFTRVHRPGTNTQKLPRLEENFQPINKHEAWVYSVFYDKLNEITFLRVMGIENNQTNNLIFCLVKDSGSNVIISGKRTVLPDTHFKKFRSVNYECRLRDGQRPQYVSIVFDPSAAATNQMPVQYPAPKTKNFTVCYSILFNFKSASQLIQNIEFNKFIGVQHFHVYNFSVSDSADVVLRHYQSQGVLTVHQWSLPSLEIWYYAQVLAINDCVYRNRNVSKYVIIQDTDEFIIPIRHNSLSDVVAIVEENFQKTSINSAKSTGKGKETLGSITFETSNYYSMASPPVWETIKQNFSISKKEEASFRKYQVLPFLHLRRINSTFKYLGRSKTMVRPERILHAGIHFTREHRDNATHAQVGADLVLLHHFRYNPNPCVLDTSAMRFKDLVFPKMLEKFFALIG